MMEFCEGATAILETVIGLALTGAKAAGALILLALALYVLVGILRELMEGEKNGKQNKEGQEDAESSGEV